MWFDTPWGDRTTYYSASSHVSTECLVSAPCLLLYNFTTGLMDLI